MARYDVTSKIQEMATMRNLTLAEMAKTYGNDLYYYAHEGKYEAWGRKAEGRIDRDLSALREKQRRANAQKALEKKLQAGTAIWRKVGYDWLVQVTGREVNVGDMIQVERRDGDTSTQLVKAIVSTDATGTYVKV